MSSTTARQRLSRLDVRLSPYLYISPFFILFAVVGLYPLLYTAFVSVHDWHLIGGQGDFVGLKNYVDVLGQQRFGRALGNTFSIFLLSSVPQVIAAIAIAAAFLGAVLLPRLQPAQQRLRRVGAGQIARTPVQEKTRVRVHRQRLAQGPPLWPPRTD